MATRRAVLAALLCLAAVAGSGPLAAAAEPTCTSDLDAQQAETARYLYELRNNRQKVCSPPDFVQDPAKAGLKLQQYCTEAAPTPGDTFINVTLQFVDACNKDKPTKLTIQALQRQCEVDGKAQDPLLQPWQADSIKIAVQPLPPNYTCPAGMENITRDTEELDFTPMWEFDHLAENAVKYKLWPEQQAGAANGLPVCTRGSSYLTTSMLSACFNNATGQYEGYSLIEWNDCTAKPQNLTFFAAGTLLPRSQCPWPMLLNSTAPKGEESGYDPAFDFTQAPAPAPAPAPASSSLTSCFAEAGLAYVDGSDPKALAKASAVWNKLNTTVALAVVWPTSAEQVAAAVKCARSAGVQAVPRGGGHSYEGYSVAPGAVTIALTLMNATTVSADQQTAVVQGGSRFGQLYFNVNNQTNGAKAAVGGTCPPVGAGALLGGGLGALMRQHGLGCDSFISARMVDAEGNILTASAEENSDLLAALCGAGNGNYGIVTDFTIKLWDLPPGNLTIAEFTAAKNDGKAQLAFMRWFQDSWTQSADPRIGVSMNPMGGEDGIFVTMQFSGNKTELTALLTADGLFSGAAKVGFNLAPKDVRFREMPWINTVIYNAGYPDVKTPSDLLNVTAMERYRPYFKLKSFFAMEALPDKALQAMLDWVPKVLHYGGYIEIDMLGPKSAVSGVPANATGFVHRSALYSIQYGAEWDKQSETANVLPLIEQMQATLDPFFAPDRPAFISYLDVQIGPNPMTSYFGENAGWLESVKAKYDPTSFWSTNPLSIPGAADSSSSAPAPDAALDASSESTASAPAPAPTDVASSSAAAGLRGALLAAAVALLGLIVMH